MKIKNIAIKDFHQFKDLSIELTYPQGHQKAGQPLDKVCFIGQSGTGKTTLLELIPKFLFDYETNITSKISDGRLFNNVTISIAFGFQNEYEVDINFEESKDEKDPKSIWNWWNIKLKGEEHDWDKTIQFFDYEWTNKIATKLIYFPANLSYDLDLDKDSILNKAIIDFSKDKVSIVWNLILESIQKYQEQELQIRQEISRTAEVASNDLKAIKKALKKLEDWKSNEFNPIQDVADKCLNNLLHYFKLRVKTALDIKTKEDIGFIKLEEFEGKEIPHSLWSTGTKQVVLSALPLYLLKPKHTVILFDEPERSLYPDIQRLIVDFYSSQTENCQFFYSTHSPIIASSFEPWEIVELKFNSEGKVYRELYYEGNNQVENYKWNPQLMRWDDILQRVFDMENDGSPKRKTELDKLATLNVKYRKLEKIDKKESEEAQKLLLEIEKLSKNLSKW